MLDSKARSHILLATLTPKSATIRCCESLHFANLLLPSVSDALDT